MNSAPNLSKRAGIKSGPQALLELRDSNSVRTSSTLNLID